MTISESEPPPGFYSYHDANLSVLLPSYLKPKKGMRFFARSPKQAKDPGIYLAAIDFPNGESATAIKQNLEGLKLIDWEGVEQRAVRRGPADALRGSFELLSTTSNTVNGDVLHRLAIIFRESGHWVFADFGGRGNVSDFDRTCKTILSSLRVKS